jgi:hypothetical protein
MGGGGPDQVFKVSKFFLLLVRITKIAATIVILCYFLLSLIFDEKMGYSFDIPIFRPGIRTQTLVLFRTFYLESTFGT